jgi:mono/diheme cytochrome c family protein
MLSALVLLVAIPFFQQTKGLANQPAQQADQQAQEPAPPKPIVIPPEAAKKANPVKPTAKSIEAGKRIFDIDCAMCHGENGDGKTDLAKSLGVKLPDFRDPAALGSVTDGGLFYVISKGHSPMPNEDVRAKPEEIWDLVNYIRSLSEKKAPPKTK